MPMRSSESGQLILFLQQLNLLLDAGVSIERSFRSIGRDSTSKLFSSFSTKVAGELEKGSTLPEILDREAKFFDAFDKALIKSCWQTGKLAEGFSQLYDHHRKKGDLSEQIKAAFVYPCILAVSAFASTIFLFTFVVPRFETIASQNEIELSLISNFVFSLANFLTQYGMILGGFILIVLLLILSPVGLTFRQSLLLSMPILGPITNSTEVGKWCRSLALLLRHDIPIQDALRLCADLYSFNKMQERGKALADQVEKGVNLTDAMAETGLFPDAAIQLSRTGGDTGNYDIMLDKAADFLTADNARKVKSIMSLVEPAVILFAGCVIALIIFALISVTMSLNASFI